MEREQREAVALAIFDLLEANEGLTKSGKPKVSAIEDAVGFSVSSSDRDFLFDYVTSGEFVPMDNRLFIEEGGDPVVSEDFQEAVPPEEPAVNVWSLIGVSGKRRPTFNVFTKLARAKGCTLGHQELLNQYNTNG